MSQVSASSSINLRWRVVDIAVASVIGVLSGFVFWTTDFTLYPAVQGFAPGYAGIINGFWLIAGPLAAIIVRKPGAAIYAEIIGAVLESLLGSQWGWSSVLIGLAQGLGAELAFIFVMYKVWNVGTAALSGALAGVACWGYTFFTSTQGVDAWGNYGVVYFITTVISGAVVAGVVMWYLTKAIAATGALDNFASGRD